MTKEIATIDESSELAIVEANARQAFNDSIFAAQVAHHNENERLIRAYQDGCEDNSEKYRQALVRAQRAYRDATCDQYADA
ncbi:MAG TPA: hypothetical protein VIE65_11385 [Methylobacter sp.]|jgi:uncharacterized protein YecT (DUF1311 family)